MTALGTSEDPLTVCESDDLHGRVGRLGIVVRFIVA